jgi:acyl-CoA thioester hydrolase
MTFFVDVTVRGYELDTQGHLNQAVYLQYAEHARRELRGGERVRVTCQFVYGRGRPSRSCRGSSRRMARSRRR